MARRPAVIARTPAPRVPGKALRSKTSPAAAPSPAPSSFAGFAPSAPAFFHELAIEMNRDWYQANKGRYQTEWVAPMTALLDGVARGIAPAYRGLTLAAPKVMRLHRDVRFSKDKTPYKTHIGGVVRAGGTALIKGGAAAVYIHLGIDDEFVGGGIHTFDTEQLARWRRVVAGQAGVELAALATRLRAEGYRVGGHDDFKRVPRGFAPDHPRADLLRARGLTVAAPAIPRGLLHRPALTAWIVPHGCAFAPVIAWLQRHVG